MAESPMPHSGSLANGGSFVGGARGGGGGGHGGADGGGNESTGAVVPHPFLQTEFDALFQYNRPRKPGLRARVGAACSRFSPTVVPRHLLRLLLCLFPALIWMPRYRRRDLLPDIVSGFTVAVMHIPQGMAYALLANVMPIVGLYMAFFPVLLYVMMGTSRHISIGSFAVLCMMANKVVQRYAYVPEAPVAATTVASVTISSTTAISNSAVANATDFATAVTAVVPETHYTPEQVVTALCLAAGAWQVALGLLRMGGVSVFMSDTLVSGFTTAAAIHVLSSQVKNLLGLRGLPARNGPLKIVYLYVDMARQLHTTNFVALGMSVGFIAALSFYNEVLKPRVGRRLSFPLPVELTAVITGTLLSYFLGLDKKITTLGAIPTGLPPPTSPPVELIPPLLVDALLVAIVGFSINMSMATIFARKDHYSVDANQELLAVGFSNVLGSFFSCVPVAASLSRSLIQHAVGGRTQVASLVSCCSLLLVLLVLGPYFETLPNCVLASIVVVALKGMLVQIIDLPKIWRRSRIDGLVWISTFLSVILIDIDYGLFIGIAMSLASVLIMTQKPKTSRLGHVPGSEIYLDFKRYQAAVEVPGVCIIQIAGGLHFANKEFLSKKLHRIITIQEKEASHKLKKKNTIIISSQKQAEAEAGEELSTELLSKDHQKSQVQFLILDMSSVCFVDPSSVKGLETLYEDFKTKGIVLCLAECPAQVYERMVNCDFFWKFPDAQLFAAVHDAVLFALQGSDANADAHTNVHIDAGDKKA